MRHGMARRMRGLVLSLLLLSCAWSAGGCRAGVWEGLFGTAPSRAEQPFAEIEYTPPDIEGLDGAIDEALALAQAGKEPWKLLSLYEEILIRIAEFDTASTIVSIRSDLDLSDGALLDESARLSNEGVRLDNRMNELTAAILDGGCADEARQWWGEEFVARFEEKQRLNAPEIEPLAEREQELVDEYRQRLAEKTTIRVDGVEMTQEELLAADLDTEDLLRYYYALQDTRNAGLAPYYPQLTALWREEVEILGFDSVTEYGYASYARDYTPAQATALAEEVAQVIPQLYYDILSAAAEAAPEEHICDPEDALPVLERALENGYPPEMSEALSYMRDYGMYDFSAGANKAVGAYTTYLPSLRAPYMMVNPASGDISTVFHEFGHYANFYLLDSYRWNDTQSLDVAEIHSQGLELLMHSEYPELYGEDADYYASQHVLSLLEAVLTGCLEDQFQQQTVDVPGLDTAQLNRIHGDLFEIFLGYRDETFWTEIPHLFESPFYYISYATSALSALDLWTVSRDDPEQAREIYAQLIGVGVNTGYRETLADCGLEDPFQSGSLRRIASGIREALGLSESGQAAA